MRNGIKLHASKIRTRPTSIYVLELTDENDHFKKITTAFTIQCCPHQARDNFHNNDVLCMKYMYSSSFNNKNRLQHNQNITRAEREREIAKVKTCTSI